MLRIIGFIAFVMLLVAIQPTTQLVQSQSEEICTTVVTDALQTLGSACTETSRNEACYGHSMVSATFRGDVINIEFSASGDTTNVLDLEALVTEPIDLDAGTWGVALMRLLADLSESNIDSLTLLLFGDTDVANAVDAAMIDLPTCSVTNARNGNLNMRAGAGTNYQVVGVFSEGQAATANGRNETGDWIRVIYNGRIGWINAPLIRSDCDFSTLDEIDSDTDDLGALYTAPMQAFVLESGQDSLCEAAPNGLLVEAPQGQKTHVMVNGVQLEFSSVGFLTADLNGNMVVYGYEGEIFVKALDRIVKILPGMQTVIALQNGLPIEPPTIPASIVQNPFAQVPLNALQSGLQPVMRFDVTELVNIRPPIVAVPSQPTSVSPQDTTSSNDNVNDTPSQPTIVCNVGVTVTGRYVAKNSSPSLQEFRVRLHDGSRYVSSEEVILLAANVTTPSTTLLMVITEPVSANVASVSMVRTDNNPSVDVQLNGSLSCR